MVWTFAYDMICAQYIFIMCQKCAFDSIYGAVEFALMLWNHAQHEFAMQVFASIRHVILFTSPLISKSTAKKFRKRILILGNFLLFSAVLCIKLFWFSWLHTEFGIYIYLVSFISVPLQYRYLSKIICVQFTFLEENSSLRLKFHSEEYSLRVRISPPKINLSKRTKWICFQFIITIQWIQILVGPKCIQFHKICESMNVSEIIDKR